MNLESVVEDKRARLVRAGWELLHQQGFQRTTLGDVAHRADVPLGNVYYYFKTKDSLCEAIVEAHAAALSADLAKWEEEGGPKQRLRALIRAPRASMDAVLAYGCPHGSLCQELEKLGAGSPLAKAGARLMEIYVAWAEAQFRALGAGARARDRAVDLVAALQGAMLLAHTFRSAELLEASLRRLERGLDRPLAETRSRETKTTAPAQPRPTRRKKP
jgi:TetR/AcrR family transcriptional regulator, transcriptional repressor for nem operon